MPSYQNRMILDTFWQHASFCHSDCMLHLWTGGGLHTGTAIRVASPLWGTAQRAHWIHCQRSSQWSTSAPCGRCTGCVWSVPEYRQHLGVCQCHGRLYPVSTEIRPWVRWVFVWMVLSWCCMVYTPFSKSRVLGKPLPDHESLEAHHHMVGMLRFMCDRNQPSLPILFLFFVPISVSGHFNCISFHKFSQQLSIFSLCSSSLISAKFVLSAIFLFMKVSFSPYIIPSGWLGSKHQLTN